MWERSKRPPFDNAVGSDSIETCMCTENWIDILLGGKPIGEYLAVERLILLTSQINPIESALLSRPQILCRFKVNVRRRVEFDVAEQSTFRVLEVYNKMRAHACRLSLIGKLFNQMDLASRHFMAQVELSRAHVFLTKDPLQRDMARQFGLLSDLV